MKKYFLFASLLFAWTLTSCDSDDSSDIEPMSLSIRISVFPTM